jgi:Tol biopolymer transport system component
MHFFNAPSVLALSVPLLALAPVSTAQSLTRVPALGGRQPTESMYLVGSTPDGSVLFLVAPDGFVAGDVNGQDDLIAFDRNTGVHTILLHALGGGSPNAVPDAPRATSAASRIVFHSDASNLVAGDTNGLMDVFILVRATGVVTRASVGNGGVQGDDTSHSGDASDDGRFVVFDSHADNLVAGSASNDNQVFLRDTLLGTTELVSVSLSGGPANASSSEEPHVSDDGRYVLWVSHATDLVPGDTNGWMDVFLRDRTAGTTTRLNVGPGGVECDGAIFYLDASADLARVVFEGYATTLVPGTDGQNEVYLIDRPTNSTSVLSVGPGGLGVNSGGRKPRISQDGRFAVYASGADLDPAVPPIGGEHVFRHELQTGQARLVSRSTGGAYGTVPPFTSGWIDAVHASNGGSLAAFQTNRRGLVAGDTNDDQVDVFLWDALSTCPPIESVCSGKTNSWGCAPAMSSSGEPRVGGPSDAFFLSTSEFMHGEIAILNWSTGPAATPFSGGTLCLAPPIVSTPGQHTGGTMAAACSDGTLSFHFSRAYMSSRGLQAGVTLYAQAYGRDRGLPLPFRTGLSDAIRFTTAP